MARSPPIDRSLTGTHGCSIQTGRRASRSGFALRSIELVITFQLTMVPGVQNVSVLAPQGLEPPGGWPAKLWRVPYLTTAIPGTTVPSS